jgi:hypothetical protein
MSESTPVVTQTPPQSPPQDTEPEHEPALPDDLPSDAYMPGPEQFTQPQQTTQPEPTPATDSQGDIIEGDTVKQKIALLEQRLLNGEISEKTYLELKNKYETDGPGHN